LNLSTVIKAGEEAHLLRRLSTVDLADHLAEARAVMDDARRRATRIVAEAEAKARQLGAAANEAGREAGHREGYAVGEEVGRKAAFDEAMEEFRKQHAEVVTAMQAATEEINARKQDLLIAAEHDVLEFAMAIARKLTFAVGDVRREAAVENLRESLRIVGGKSNVTVYANPKDVETLGTVAAGLAELTHAAAAVRIVPDESIGAGGCRVETDRTEVDATLETQLDSIVAVLTGSMRTDA
jgi:flagellar assembly protein FliH